MKVSTLTRDRLSKGRIMRRLMTEETCASCCFWRDQNAWWGGQCRIAAPSLPDPEKVPSYDKAKATWPQTKADDFCGEHQWRPDLDRRLISAAQNGDEMKS